MRYRNNPKNTSSTGFTPGPAHSTARSESDSASDTGSQHGGTYQPLSLALTAITGIRIEGGDIVVGARQRRGRQRRCPECGQRRGRYDAGRGTRRWRALDLDSARCFLEYVPRRVRCPEHGVCVEAAPWTPDPRSHFTGPSRNVIAAIVFPEPVTRDPRF